MKISVYLSHATPHTRQAAQFLEKLSQEFAEKGIECVYVTSKDVQTSDAIRAIKGRLKGCSGLIAVAFERRLIVKAVNKNEADIPGARTSYMVQVKQTTPYIQIETAIALAYDLPVLVLKEFGLLEEGILEPCCAGIDGPCFDINDEDFFKSERFRSAMDMFLLSVEEAYNGRQKKEEHS